MHFDTAVFVSWTARQVRVKFVVTDVMYPVLSVAADSAGGQS